ncbi:hypothetical protein N2152v2_006532 [Parachlorella kessleri]
MGALVEDGTGQQASPTAQGAAVAPSKQDFGAVRPVGQQQSPNQPGPARPSQHNGTGFSRWLRIERAKGDTFGYCLALVFHIVTLSKYKALPTGHIIYYTVYTLAVVCLLAWQRSGDPAYAAWRDWIQAAIRLDVFLSPARIRIWEHSVNLSPPSLPGPVTLSYMATIPVSISNTFTVHLLMLPFAHSLGLWPHILVQAICISRLAVGAFNRQVCQHSFFSHATTKTVMSEAYAWLEALGLLSFRPLPTHRPGFSSVSEQQCLALALWLVFVVGFGVSVAAQTALDARLYRRFLRDKQQQQRQPQAGHHQPSAQLLHSAGLKIWAGAWYDRLFDSLSGKYLSGLARACRKPRLWFLLAVAVWDVLLTLLS